jgi:hypothetical protein
MTSAAVGERHIDCNKAANQYAHGVYRYQADHDRFTTDLDTPEDYVRLLARMSRQRGTTTLTRIPIGSCRVPEVSAQAETGAVRFT